MSVISLPHTLAVRIARCSMYLCTYVPQHSSRFQFQNAAFCNLQGSERTVVRTIEPFPTNHRLFHPPSPTRLAYLPFHNAYLSSCSSCTYLTTSALLLLHPCRRTPVDKTQERPGEPRRAPGLPVCQSTRLKSTPVHSSPLQSTKYSSQSSQSILPTPLAAYSVQSIQYPSMYLCIQVSMYPSIHVSKYPSIYLSAYHLSTLLPSPLPPSIPPIKSPFTLPVPRVPMVPFSTELSPPTVPLDRPTCLPPSYSTHPSTLEY